MLLYILMHLLWVATHFFSLDFSLFYFISYSQSLYATLHDKIIFLAGPFVESPPPEIYVQRSKSHESMMYVFCSIEDFSIRSLCINSMLNGKKNSFSGLYSFFKMFFRRPSPIVFLFSVLWLISVHTDVYTHIHFRYSCRLPIKKICLHYNWRCT